MIALNKTIRLFLDGIGRRDEYEFYLDKFQADRTACFALLCPDLGSIEAGAEVLAFDLHFLQRLELVPAILLCGDAAAPMRAALEKEPIFAFHSLELGAEDTFIQTTRASEKVPVLIAEKMDLKTTLLNLVPSIAQRVHFIRAAGGLKNSAGELLPYIHTHKEMEQPLESLEYDFLALGKTLLEKRPGVHLSVTSSINLLQEIFTVKGAGTLFRKGSVIESFCETETLDADRLQNLFETSFGKQLTNKAFLENVAYAYVEQDYRGAVLLEKHPNGLYLSKFAVDREARGEGLALELWREVARHHPAFFWRSKTTNSFNAWYRNQADGYHISEPWQIFWRGVPAPAISSIIEFCHTRAEDFSAR